MTDIRNSRGHSRKLKVGVGGQPVQSWQNDIELQPTTSVGKVTAAHNTDANSGDVFRHPVANGGSKQAFTAVNSRGRREGGSFPVFHSKNAPVKVSVSGEWALKECEEHTSWANHLLKRTKHRTCSDIRRSIGDGQTLVYILESLAGQKIPGVYAHPITRAQKLENLQLCMSFMGNRNINLQGIYVGDLIDGNVKSVLNLCRNVRKQFEGVKRVSPDGARPGSSESTKEGDFRMMNGFVPQQLPASNGYDGDGRPHGNSSGYHSDDYSPTRRSETSPLHQDFGVPGMLHDKDSPKIFRKTVNPSDVIITTRTELDKKGVLQTAEHPFTATVRTNGTISLEERLRSLLSSPNPGGQVEEETEEELLIPPPPKASEPFDDDVERRLQSLLDVANDDSPEVELTPKDFSNLKELDRIGYMPSHPSQKTRNVQKGRGQARTDSFTGNAKKSRGAKLPPAPQSRRKSSHDSESSSQSPVARRKSGVSTYPLPKRTMVTSSDVSVSRPQLIGSQNPPNERPAMLHREQNKSTKLIRGEGTPPVRQHRAQSHSEFLQQVAEKLADKSHDQSTTSTGSGGESVSPAATPMLPTLSPSSSVATFIFASTSESSGLSSDEDDDDYRSQFKRPGKSRNGSATSRSRKERRSSFASAKSTQDMQGIRTQLESLEVMYSEILSTMDVNSKDTKQSKDKHSQRVADVRAGLAGYKKQRNKDIKAVNKRFGRLESHVVTLARSVAHLSSELRSQAAISQDMDDMRKQVQQFRGDDDEDGAANIALLQSLQFATSQKRVKKLRSFFGADPPLLALFLKTLGYERFAENFEAEQVGILELPYMTEERLQGMGIPLGPRLRIMEEVKKLTGHHK